MPRIRRTATPISVAVDMNHCIPGLRNPMLPNQAVVRSRPRAWLMPWARNTRPMPTLRISKARSVSMSPSLSFGVLAPAGEPDGRLCQHAPMNDRITHLVAQVIDWGEAVAAGARRSATLPNRRSGSAGRFPGGGSWPWRRSSLRCSCTALRGALRSSPARPAPGRGARRSRSCGDRFDWRGRGSRAERPHRETRPGRGRQVRMEHAPCGRRSPRCRGRGIAEPRRVESGLPLAHRGGGAGRTGCRGSGLWCPAASPSAVRDHPGSLSKIARTPSIVSASSAVLSVR